MWRRGGAAAVSDDKDVSMLDQNKQLIRANDDVGAVFVTRTGVEEEVLWWQLPGVIDELGRSVRSFPSYRGQWRGPSHERQYDGRTRLTALLL